MPRAKKATRYTQCTVMRRKLVKHYDGFDNALAGIVAKEEWVTEPCGAPLFGGDNERTGVCRSCAKGWTHPHNYPVKPWLAYARTGPSHRSASTAVDHGTVDGKTTLCGLKEIGGSDPGVTFPAKSGGDCRRCLAATAKAEGRAS